MRRPPIQKKSPSQPKKWGRPDESLDVFIKRLHQINNERIKAIYDKIEKDLQNARPKSPPK